MTNARPHWHYDHYPHIGESAIRVFLRPPAERFNSGHKQPVKCFYARKLVLQRQANRRPSDFELRYRRLHTAPPPDTTGSVARSIRHPAQCRRNCECGCRGARSKFGALRQTGQRKPRRVPGVGDAQERGLFDKLRHRSHFARSQQSAVGRVLRPPLQEVRINSSRAAVAAKALQGKTPPTGRPISRKADFIFTTRSRCCLKAVQTFESGIRARTSSPLIHRDFRPLTLESAGAPAVQLNVQPERQAVKLVALVCVAGGWPPAAGGRAGSGELGAGSWELGARGRRRCGRSRMAPRPAA